MTMPESDLSTRLEQTHRSVRLSLGSLLLNGALAVLALLLAGARHSLMLRGIGYLAAIGAAVAGLSLLHAALRRQAVEEEREDTDLNAGADSHLFSDAGERVRARNLRQFERYFVPVLTLAIAVGEAVFGLQLWRHLATHAVVPLPERALATAAILAVAGIATYLLGSYQAGLAFRGRHETLRAVAGENIGLAGLCLVGMVMALLLRLGLPAWPAGFAWVLAVLLLARAVEKLLTGIMELYRPRRARGEQRLLYESRLNGLFAQPRGVLANIAETLNYQFGFKLSEDRFRTALYTWLPLLIIFELVVFAVVSCVVVVNPGEQALRERWGRPYPAADPILEPGVHVKLPWPADRVYRAPVARVQRLDLAVPYPEDDGQRLWTGDPAGQRDYMLVAASADAKDSALALVTVRAAVHYRIDNLRQYLYASTDPAAFLATLARREIVRSVARRDLFGLLTADRDVLAGGIRDRLQAVVRRHELGLTVLDVSVTGIQPPARTAAAFQEFFAAQQDRRRTIAAAEATAAATVTAAHVKAATDVSAAAAAGGRRRAVATAERDNFLAILEVDRKYGRVYRGRAYLDVLEQALAKRPKTILATAAARQLYNLDLKHKLSQDIFGIQPEE